MQSIVLDTSFILAAVEKKIDFFDILEGRGFQILVPQQAIRELQGLGAMLALQILRKNKFRTIRLPGKDADTAILAFAKRNPGAVMATLDKGLQKKLKNRKLVIRGHKRLEIS